jgi:TRAP-type transport system periplasmic protein
LTARRTPLSILNAAKFYEVTEQVILTSHMVQPVFFSIAKSFYDKLTPEQRAAVQAAAVVAAKSNDDGRLADETSVADALRTKGLTVEAIDLAPFRLLADKTYAEAELARAWDAGLLKRVADAR